MLPVVYMKCECELVFTSKVGFIKLIIIYRIKYYISFLIKASRNFYN